MAPKFGTSGLRGLVDELTPALVADHVRAFLAACDPGTGLWLGRDLRASSPALAAAVAQAARGEGVAVTDCGALPTPALAMASMAAGAAAVMVTGSHIPADRNGLKFYRPDGEITKDDEAAILAALGRPAAARDAPLRHEGGAGDAWVGRVLAGFGPDALAGMRVGVWSHSSVARDLLAAALAGLGALAVEFGRSDSFVPVDTEAVPDAVRAMLADRAAALALDAVVSTDGDGDRPLLADAEGRIVAGDVLGQIAAGLLGADCIVTPVSSNTGAEAAGRFARVLRTRIGSPHVIAAMQGQARNGARVAGYEANGGFLLGFAAQGPTGPLPPLMTRDSLLPLAAVLAAARAAGGVAARVAAEPARFTASDRLEDVATERSAALVAALAGDGAARDAFLAGLAEVHADSDLTDGLRMHLASGRILHLRPSGNAPEMRIYAEAATAGEAAALMAAARAAAAARLG